MADRHSPWTPTRDDLTGLPNRYEFERRLARAMAGQASNHSHHCLAHLYLDRFRNVVLQAGAEAGDALLLDIARLLGTRLRTRDTLARLDDHAFGLLLEHCPVDRARELLWSLVTVVADHRLAWGNREYQTSISAGLVAMTPGNNSVTQLLSYAEVACHIAREHLGGGVYLYHDEPLAPEAPDMPDTTTVLPRLRLQPLLGLDQHPSWRRLQLDRGGAGESLNDRWLLTELATLNLPGEGPLLIPMSIASLADPRLLAELVALAQDPGQLLVEVAWRELLDDAHIARQVLRDCRRHGVGVVGRNFPGDLTAFQQLCQWPLQGVILDSRAFPQCLTRSAVRPLLQGLLRAIQGLDLWVIIDAVDDREALAAARDLAVDLVGGKAVAAARPLGDGATGAGQPQ